MFIYYVYNYYMCECILGTDDTGDYWTINTLNWTQRLALSRELESTRSESMQIGDIDFESPRVDIAVVM